MVIMFDCVTQPNWGAFNFMYLGWHLCSICEKNAYYMCYTCTFSLCKGCIKDAVILCVRGNKGFCETCMRTVMLIETNQQGNKEMVSGNFFSEEKSVSLRCHSHCQGCEE